MITTEIDDKKVQFLFGRIKNNAMNMKRPMRIIAAELEESVRENFEVGGRYSDAKSIIGGQNKWKKGKYGGSLIRTGNLRDSITSKSDKTSASVGTNLKYARILNDGGDTKPHEIRARNVRALSFNWNGKRVFLGKVNHPGSHIPARPFMVVQPEDIESFKETLLEHLTENT